MTARSSLAQQLERQSVVLMESTIPRDMTCEQWRRRRSARRRPVRDLMDLRQRAVRVPQQAA
jgi:hypothetical protein